MSQTATSPSSSITDMIRADHEGILGTLQGYRTDTTPAGKQKLVATASAALETHAQLKAEILYPALRALNPAPPEAPLARGEAAHHQLHSLIGQLRDMRPTATRYDDTFASLLEVFTRHVKDEEATLLPQAERLLPTRLHELGAKMATRRLLLDKAPLGGVGGFLVAAGSLLAGGYLLKRAWGNRAQA